MSRGNGLRPWATANGWSSARAIPCLCWGLVFLVAGRIEGATNPVLTSAGQVRALSRAEAEKGLPVRFEAVVTYTDPEFMCHYVQDGTGGLSILPRQNQVTPAVGQRVLIQGETGAGTSLPIVRDASWQSLGAGELPQPTPLSLSRIAGRADDAQWMEATGRVVAAGMQSGRLRLNIDCQGAQVRAVVRRAPVFETHPERWVGASVRARGVFAVEVKEGRSVGSQLLVNGLEDVARDSDVEETVFEMPLSSLGSLTNLGQTGSQRVRVRGRLAGLNTNGVWRVRDATGQALASGLSNVARVGDQVEIVGLAQRERNNVVLSEGVARWLAWPQSTKTNVLLGFTNLVPGLTTARSIQGLTAEESRRGLPVRLKGVVTYSNLKLPPRICLQDDTGGIWVRVWRSSNEVAVGMLVEVDGYTTMGSTRPEVQQGRVTVRGQGRLPTARGVSLQEALRGLEEAQWVVLPGIVRNGRIENDSLTLFLMNPGGRFRVEIPGITNETLLGDLIDAEVRVRGVCGATLGSRRQITGVKLFAPSLGQIIVERPPPNDPFAGQPQSIASLAQENLAPGRHRVLVQGVVTHSRSPTQLCLRDDTGAAYVQLARSNSVSPGTRVEVVGFPTAAQGQAAPVLQDAVARVLRREALPPPVEALPGQLRNGALDAQLVKLNAVLLESTHGSNQWNLRLRRGQFLFDAELELKPGEVPPRFEQGSDLEVTGVCWTMLDEQRQPGTFRILMRSLADVRVLRIPPWWTTERTVAALGISTLLVLGALGWVWLLRRRVRTQTALIRERAVREQTLEARYRELFQNATDIVYTLDLQGNLTSVNPAGESIFGAPLRNGEPVKLARLVVPEHQSRLVEMLSLAPEAPGPAVSELDLRSPDGRTVKLEINSRLLVENGAVTGFQGIARDITKRHALEQQLRQAAKMESVGRLAGGVAHDFNNILTTIGGHAALLLEEASLRGWLRASVGEVAKAAERAADLTRQLLTFSRRQPMQKVLLDLNGVIADIGPMLRRLMGEHIQLQINFGPTPVDIRADRSMMEQVILNLVVNARDAIEARQSPAPPGRLTLTSARIRFDEREVRQNPERSQGEFACLKVADNGCGMSPETRQNIFEPFYTTKDVGKGTGLGLATVYGVVQDHSGWIEVDSAPGQGTEFRVCFPLAKRSDKGVLEEPPGPMLGGHETVLLVEDEAPVRSLAQEALTRLGYRVLVAESGAAALKVWAREAARIDLLLTDVVMPEGVSGLDLGERLHREKPALKIIYTSGYSMEAAERKLRKGINLLPKPFSVRALAKTVRECLDSR